VPEPQTDERALIEPGTRVEVRSRFDGSWARGFEVAAHVPGGYQVRRRSDGSLLPTAFAPEDVRVDRSRQGLWWA
jgi:hypothetical protein